MRASAKRAGRFVRSISPRNQHHCRSRMKPVSMPCPIMTAIIAYLLSLNFPLLSRLRRKAARMARTLTFVQLVFDAIGTSPPPRQRLHMLATVGHLVVPLDKLLEELQREPPPDTGRRLQQPFLPLGEAVEPGRNDVLDRLRDLPLKGARREAVALRVLLQGL